MKEFFLNLLTGTLESAGESKLVDVLQKLHDKDKVQYEAALRGGYALTLALTPLVTDTKTQIDDAFLKALHEAIVKSATDNGVTL